MAIYFVALLALLTLLVPIESQAYNNISRSKRVIAVPSYRAVTERNVPVIGSQVVSRPIITNIRSRVVDHRTNVTVHGTHEQEHGHGHSHDSIGVRQILGSFLPFF